MYQIFIESWLVLVSLDYALDENNKSLKYVDDVPVGAKCGCICPICDEPLIAYNKGLEQAHHFGHFSGVEHTINPMTRLHILAQIILAKSFRFQLMYNPIDIVIDINARLRNHGLEIDENEIHSYHQISLVDKTFTGGSTEYTQTTSQGPLRYDVYFSDANLAVEIYVTHRVNSEKQHKMKDVHDWCVEIDLSDVNRNISYEKLEELLNNLIFENSEKIFGYGPYVEYVDAIFKQYDKYLDDALYVRFISEDVSARMKRKIVNAFLGMYGSNYTTSEEGVYDFRSKGVCKVYDKLSHSNFHTLYSQLNQYEITLIMEPVPGKEEVQDVSLEWGDPWHFQIIRVGWVYLPEKY